MNVNREIEEVKNLLDDALSVIPDNDLIAQWKSKVVRDYSQALKTLLEIERMNAK